MSRLANSDPEHPERWEARPDPAHEREYDHDDARRDQEADENRRQLLADRELDEQREAHETDRREAEEEAGACDTSC
jgi:hypothetical protein